MDELGAPESLKYEQIAHDTVLFHIKKPYGVLTGAITKYRVKWKEPGKSEEYQKLFDNPNCTKLEVDGLHNGAAYDFSFESGSRLRFGKPSHIKGIVLDNWRPELFASKLQESSALIGRLNDWTDNTAKQMLEKVFGDEKSKLLVRRRSSIFHRLPNSIKFSSRITKGTYLAFLISDKDKIVLTAADKTVPTIRIDKTTENVTDALLKWYHHLPRHHQDLLAIQRINEECLQNENSTSSSLEREILRTLLALLMLTSYEKFNFYHYKPVKNEESVVLVVGARGQGIFAENLQWYSLSKQTPKCEVQKELFKIGQFYESFRRPMKPGLYVADLRLVSDIKKIQVQTCRHDPAYLPYAFVRSNSHINKREWSWLNTTEVEYTNNLADSDQLLFYRQFFQATTELFEKYNNISTEQRMEYRICNNFLLEYGQISMILIYPGPTNIVNFKAVDVENPNNKTLLLPGSVFEREYLRHISSSMFDRYSKIRAHINIFKQALKMEKMQERRVKTWSKSVSQNVVDAEKMLTKFDSEISWLNSVVSRARKNEGGIHLLQLQQQFELFEILSYSQSSALRSKLNKINVTINFSSLYPAGTAMLVQLKQDTIASDVVQLILQRCFTKAQLSQMDESDFYLAVSCGVRERRLRSTLKLCELDDPWIDGEFCIRQCVPAEMKRVQKTGASSSIKENAENIESTIKLFRLIINTVPRLTTQQHLLSHQRHPQRLQISIFPPNYLTFQVLMSDRQNYTSTKATSGHCVRVSPWLHQTMK